jgi:hypothetical protein
MTSPSTWIITGKVRAFWDRQATRDYIDVDAILQTGRWSPSDLLAALQRVRPEASPEMFAEMLGSANTADRHEYEGYHLDQREAAAIIARLKLAAGKIIR